MEKETTVQSGAEPAVPDASVTPGSEVPAGTATDPAPETMNAFQKFLASLMGGKKESDDAASGSGQDSKDDAGTPAPEPSKTFTQADIDAAVAAAQQGWDKERQREKLSPEERTKAERDEATQKVAGLEQKLLAFELKTAAVASLTKDGFPVGLADMLDYTDKAGMEKSLAALTKMYKDNLAEGIQQRLRGKTPEGLGGAAGTENMIKDQIAKNIRGGI